MKNIRKVKKLVCVAPRDGLAVSFVDARWEGVPLPSLDSVERSFRVLRDKGYSVRWIKQWFLKRGLVLNANFLRALREG